MDAPAILIYYTAVIFNQSAQNTSTYIRLHGTYTKSQDIYTRSRATFATILFEPWRVVVAGALSASGNAPPKSAPAGSLAYA
jgi:hypothetical protein